MTRLLMGLSALALAVTAGPARPDDKKKDAAPSGTWTREANGLDLKMEFVGKGVLKASVAQEDNGVTVTAKYTVENGVVKAKVTDVEEKGKFPAKPPKGLEFSFKWVVKKGGTTAELLDFKAEGLEDAKNVIEGEYVAAKKK